MSLGLEKEFWFNQTLLIKKERKNMGILKGVISQQLVPLKDGGGRVAATEILIGNDAVGNLIRQDKAHQLDSTMQAGASLGMHTLNSDLERLVKEGSITRESAFKVSSNPQNLRV